ncbi:hypothetical protein [Trichococcus collinsii]|uniref:Control of competence regulator comk ylbf/ymca n=1 Tax=Trichococcus collinsii TaxID=157076 RepID=A0AB37ZWP4_9LACT|nr:hypothetical protein [Trichococcus collinsii]CZQ82363.1 Hypothetical protein Tcol_206 [Trichococcus collinsii]SDZ87504.1 hypothetical protein SAMN04488525_101473 [Trichococcus collinsii]
MAVPVYDKEEMNVIERDIERTKLMARFKAALEVVEDNPYMDTYRLIVELMEKAQQEIVLQKNSRGVGPLPSGVAGLGQHRTEAG